MLEWFSNKVKTWYEKRLTWEVRANKVFILFAHKLVFPQSKGRHQWQKKNVFFRAFPESPNPPPPDPNSGNLVLFFGRQKRRFALMTKFFFNDDNDGFNDNYDDNFGNFDDIYDKND